MGKRTRPAFEDFESLAKKVKVLEQKLKRTRRRDRSRTSRLSSTSSSDSSNESSRSDSDSRSGSRPPPAEPMPPATLCIEDVPIPSTSAAAAATPAAAAAAAAAAPTPTSAAAVTELPSTYVTGTEILQQPSTDSTPALDDELMLILGDDPSQAKSYGEPIQPDLAIRLEYIARTGLTKEIRKELTEKYLPPANCVLIEAPTLNPEVVAAVPEAILKRDKGIELRQKQRTSAISCVAEALTLLMSTDHKDTVLIQKLMDAIKLMCDSQYTESTIRRNFILNTLKKDLKDQLEATKIDKLLFSKDLAETLKVAKAISKSGADMKPAPAKQPPAKNKPQQKRHLNWRAPPQNYRPKGNPRRKEPAYKDRRDNSSKPSSSRPPRSRSRNRR